MRLVSFRREGMQAHAGIYSELGIIDIYEGMALLSEDRPESPLSLHDIIRGGDNAINLATISLLEEVMAAQQIGRDVAYWFGGVEMLMRRDDVQLLAPFPGMAAWWRSVQNVQAYERMMQRRGEHLGMYWYERPPLWAAAATVMYGDRALIPFPDTTACDIECEIAWVLGRDVYQSDASDALDAVLGLCLLGNIVARDRADDDVVHGLWSRQAGIVMGPMLTTVDELDEFLLGDGRMRITIQILVNDVVRASMNIRDVHYTIGDVVAQASQGMTVAAGTVFSSGALCSLSDVAAPWIVPGDEVIIDAGPLGTLRWTMEEWQ